MMDSLDALALDAPKHGLAGPRSEPAAMPVTEIGPDNQLVAFDAAGVWQYRGLLWVLILRDLKVLYRQTALGACWAIAQPLFTVAIFTVIFGHFAKIPTDGAPYALFAGSAIILWTYFAESVRRSATGLVTEAELIRKIYFPRLVIPLATVVSPMVDFAIALAVMLVLMLCYGVMPSWHIVLAVPTLAVTALALLLAVAADLRPARTALVTAAVLAGLGHEVVEHTPTMPRSFRSDFEDYWSLLALGVVTSGRRLFGAGVVIAALATALTLGLQAL